MWWVRSRAWKALWFSDGASHWVKIDLLIFKEGQAPGGNRIVLHLAGDSGKLGDV